MHTGPDHNAHNWSVSTYCIPWKHATSQQSGFWQTFDAWAHMSTSLSKSFCFYHRCRWWPSIRWWNCLLLADHVRTEMADLRYFDNRLRLLLSFPDTFFFFSDPLQSQLWSQIGVLYHPPRYSLVLSVCLHKPQLFILCLLLSIYLIIGLKLVPLTYVFIGFFDPISFINSQHATILALRTLAFKLMFPLPNVSQFHRSTMFLRVTPLFRFNILIYVVSRSLHSFILCIVSILPPQAAAHAWLVMVLSIRFLCIFAPYSPPLSSFHVFPSAFILAITAFSNLLLSPRVTSMQLNSSTWLNVMFSLFTMIIVSRLSIASHSDLRFACVRIQFMVHGQACLPFEIPYLVTL